MRSFKLSARRRSWMGLPLFLSFFLALMLVASSLQGTWDVAYASHCGQPSGSGGTATGTVPGTNIGTVTGGSTDFVVVVSASLTSIPANGADVSTITATLTSGSGAIANATVKFTSTIGTVTVGSSSDTAVGSTRAQVSTTTNSSGMAFATLQSTTTGSATVDVVVFDTGGTARACPETTVTLSTPVVEPAPSEPAPAPTPLPTAEPPTVVVPPDFVPPPLVEVPPEQVPPPITDTMPTSGGTMEVPSTELVGGVTFEVPPGAFTAPTELTLQVIPEATTSITDPTTGASMDVIPPSGTELGQKTIEIVVPRAVEAEPLGTAVLMNVTLTDRELGGRPIEAAGFGRIDPQSGRVTPLPVEVVDKGNGILRVRLDHLSKFTLFFATKLPPTLLEPVNRAILPTLGRALKWTNPPSTTWFQIQVVPFNNDGPGIDLIVGDTAMVQAAQYEVKAPSFGVADANYVMLPGITYTWRVRTATTTTAPTEADWSAWALRIFRTTSVGSYSIGLQSPADQSVVGSTGPTLTWVNSDRQVFYYEVQVSADPAFSTGAGAPPLYWNLVHGGVSTPSNSYIVPSSAPLQSGTTYYWRVRPRIQGDGVSVSWTVPRSFTTP